MPRRTTKERFDDEVMLPWRYYKGRRIVTAADLERERQEAARIRRRGTMNPTLWQRLLAWISGRSR